VVTVGQVLKLTKLYQQNHKELSDALAKAQKKIDALETNIRALNSNRHNKRYEIYYETPTLISGDTYELSNSYDPNALFLVFNGVVKVVESAITLGVITDVEPDSKRFDCTVPLIGTAIVVYFSRIPKLTQPSFP